MHVMRSVGECEQHAFGVRAVCRLRERMSVELDGCICAEHKSTRMQRVNRLRLLECEPLHVGRGIFGGDTRLVDVRGDDVESEADLSEELPPARRGGGEDEPHQASASTEM